MSQGISDMFRKYVELVKKLVENLPFFNYLTRLLIFLRYPSIEHNQRTSEQLKHSLLDVVNALGLGTLAVTAIKYYDQSNNYLGVLEVFNPLYISGICIYYGLILSTASALFFCVIAITPLSERSHDTQDFYRFFTHSLRVYAALIFFMTPLFVHAYGQIILKGISMRGAFNKPLFLLYIVVVLLCLPFRLYINPVYRYLKPSSHRFLLYCCILVTPIFASEINQRLSPDISSKLILGDKLCDAFKVGSFYKSLDGSHQRYAEKYFCKGGQ
jgi:hypothetical protein